MGQRQSDGQYHRERRRAQRHDCLLRWNQQFGGGSLVLGERLPATTSGARSTHFPVRIETVVLTQRHNNSGLKGAPESLGRPLFSPILEGRGRAPQFPMLAASFSALVRGREAASRGESPALRPPGNFFRSGD